MTEPPSVERPPEPVGQAGLREALQALDRAREAPPLEASREAALAERRVVQARNAWIERLRREPDADQAAEWREQLGRANAGLSLIAGVEYPTSGLRREIIDQARAVIAGMLDLATPGDEHG